MTAMAINAATLIRFVPSPLEGDAVDVADVKGGDDAADIFHTTMLPYTVTLLAHGEP